MLNSLFRLALVIFGIASVMPLSSQAGTVANPPADPGQYVLFIHAGRAPSDKGDLIRNIAIALAKSGYVVRAPDQESKQGGPAVDFFDEKNRPAAEHIASVVNELKGGPDELKPRLQPVKHPEGYIDVWLF